MTSELPPPPPLAVVPVFRMTAANQSLVVYRGGVRFTQGSFTAEGPGEIRFDWLPRPAVRFDVRIELSMALQFNMELADAKLGIDGGTLELQADVMHIGDRLAGNVRPVVMGKETDVSHLAFSLPNFLEYRGDPIGDNRGSAWVGRAVLEASDWRVTLDGLFPLREVKDELKSTGGYAVTHAGKVERISGNSIPVDDARALREDLFWFLSFCRGRWTGAVLMTGHTSDGETEWTDLASTKISAWGTSHSWMREGDGDWLARCFPGYMKLRESPLWKEPITLAIHWFVEANMCAGGIEGGIVLTQAALEMIGWHLMVEDRKTCSSQGFKTLPAEGKIRLLLAECRIPLACPDVMQSLVAECRAFNWADGPAAITQIRNALAHGQPKQLTAELQRDNSVRHSAWSLGLWYLELVLLQLFGYEGRYFSRIKGERWVTSNLDTVPWSD